MLAEVQNSNPYTKISAKDYSSNSQYMMNVYGNEKKLQYYDRLEQDTYTPTKNKKNKKGKILGAVLATTAIITVSSLLFASKGKIKLNSINSKAIQEGAKKVQEDTKGCLEKAGNALANLTNIKDDLWNRFTKVEIKGKQPLGFIKEAGDALTDKVIGIVKKSFKGSYEHSLNKVKKLTQDANINLEDFLPKNAGDIKDYDGMFKEINDQVCRALHDQDISKTLTSGEGSKIGNIFRKMTKGSIALGKLEEKGIASTLDKYKFDIKKMGTKGISKEIIKACEEHNNMIDNALVGKLKDLHCGSAPTDIISVALPTAGFGIALHNAETKEEKKSVLFDLAIPLIPTILMPVAGWFMPALNGAKAVVAGLAAGQVFKQGANIIDKSLNKNSSNQTV